MQETELRTFVLDGLDPKWGYPMGRDIISRFANGDYVCLTYKGINYWKEGKLELSVPHDAETQARYDALLQRHA
ncbi:MAG TPA: hypothetical protein VGK24_00045 [Candidatus Angelobacter sp.]|jgi:hypothetical protein